MRPAGENKKVSIRRTRAASGKRAGGKVVRRKEREERGACLGESKQREGGRTGKEEGRTTLVPCDDAERHRVLVRNHVALLLLAPGPRKKSGGHSTRHRGNHFDLDAVAASVPVFLDAGDGGHDRPFPCLDGLRIVSGDELWKVKSQSLKNGETEKREGSPQLGEAEGSDRCESS
jgi:hypothetical protein